MDNIKDLTRKIQSLKSMRKITRAMKMISATKLRKANDNLRRSILYDKSLHELIAIVEGGVSEHMHPFYKSPAIGNEGSSLLIVIASNRGLCGSFNSAIIRNANAYCKKREGSSGLMLSLIGRKACDAFKTKEWKIFQENIECVSGKTGYAEVAKLAEEIISCFLSGKVKEVNVLYTEYRSSISQVPVIKQLLPIVPEARPEEGLGDPIIEPEPDAVLGKLVMRAISYRLYKFLLQSITSEHAARMTAMDSATRNTNDLLDSVTLKRNKLRQAAITRELVEIVSGAESLK
jgi:F-type H+-transporting ATPase subunit gamma